VVPNREYRGVAWLRQKAQSIRISTHQDRHNNDFLPFQKGGIRQLWNHYNYKNLLKSEILFLLSSFRVARSFAIGDSHFVQIEERIDRDRGSVSFSIVVACSDSYLFFLIVQKNKWGAFASIQHEPTEEGLFPKGVP
jgi:hypothetical protein